MSEREHLCVICQKRQFERAQACTPCRDRLPTILADIVDLHAQLPDALQPTQSGTQRVSGSRAPSAPIALDVVDLAGEARAGSTHDTMVPATVVEPVAVKRRYIAVVDGRPVEAEERYDARQRRVVPGRYVPAGDQIGHVAVASLLDAWVRDWRDEMAFTQSLPVPTVPELARWLSNRCDWACDRHPAVDEFASEMVRIRGLLRAVLGLTEPEAEFCDGVVCKRCDRYALYRESDYVECDECGLLYSDEEYREWVGLLAEHARRMAA